MTRKNQDDVLIAGAGPAGLAAALFLDEHGVPVEVLDPHERAPDDEFAVVLRRETVGRLAAAGVTFDPIREARVLDAIHVYEGPRRGGHLALAPRDGGAITVPSYVLCKRLAEALHARGVKVRWDHRLARLDLADDRVYVDVDGLGVDSSGISIAWQEKIVESTSRREPSYLIAADGGGSVVRTQLRVGMRSLGSPQRVVTFGVDTGADPGNEAHVVIGDATVEIWPLAGREVQVIVIEPRLPIHTPPDVSDLLALIDFHAPGHPMPVHALRRARVEQLQPATAERPNVGRVWLLGGAARTLPASPFAVDETLRDAHRLAAAFAHAMRTHERPELFVEHLPA